MDGARLGEQRESDDRSAVPMGPVSVNNLHISLDSFEKYGSLSRYNVATGILKPQPPLNKVIFKTTFGQIIWTLNLARCLRNIFEYLTCIAIRSSLIFKGSVS